MAIAICTVVADGSRRTPADATKPIEIRGSVTADIESNRLRVATFNVHSGKGKDRRTDLPRVAKVFDLAPDIAGLNEVRGTIDDRLYPDQAAELGKLLSMDSVFLPTERRWWHDHFGNALLTRIPIGQIHRIPLEGTRGKAFRFATLAQFEFQQRTVQLLTAHVDSQSDREHQLRAIISLFNGLQPPVILMGDLNSSPEDPQMRQLLEQPDVSDALQDIKGHRIDWILTRGFRVFSGRMIENDASDHPAVVAELELADPHQ